MIRIGINGKKDNRHKYVVDFIVKNLGLNPVNIDYFESDLFEIIYKKKHLKFSDSILAEMTGLVNFRVNLNRVEYLSYEFFTLFDHEDDEVGPDILATIYWFLTRYEEYTMMKRDISGRFLMEYSQLNREDYLVPVVDDIVKQIAGLLGLTNNFLSANHHPKVCLTHDIDHPVIYKNVTTASMFRSLCGDLIRRRSLGLFVKRLLASVLRSDRLDPANNISWILDANKGERSIFFYIATSDLGPHNTNVPVSDCSVENQLIELLDKSKVEVGIHPSLNSGGSFDMLSEEIKLLSHKTGNAIKASRMHYVKYDIRNTFEYLNKLGISKDYTMLFPDGIGWKTGTCRPYLWHDVLKNRNLGIEIYTTCFMDVSAFKYLKMDEGTCRRIVASLLSTNNQYNGTFVTLWHNTELMTKRRKKLYAEIIEIITSCKN